MTTLAIALVVPWGAGTVLVLLDGRRRVVGWVAVAVLAGNLAALGVLTALVLRNGPISVTTGNWPEGVGITLHADALGVVFALLSSFVVLTALVHEVIEGTRERVFPGLVVLLAAGLTGVFLTGDIFNFYVFFELAMTASYILATYGGTKRELGAALVFMAVNLLGTFIFLLAVAAILSGAVANIGAYGLLRFGGELLPRELEVAGVALVVIGGASILYGGVLAISRRSAGEMLAYSAIGQIGYVLVAIGIGGQVAFAAAILYTAVNALNKTLLFLSAQMRGAVVAGVFALGAFSVAGVPPAAGFVGKLELFRAAAGSPALIALFFVGSALSFVYAFQIYQHDFWRGPRPGTPSAASEQVVVAALALLVLAVGIWPEPLLALSHDAAEALTRGAP